MFLVELGPVDRCRAVATVGEHAGVLLVDLGLADRPVWICRQT